jgi:hypothetical protein
VIIVAPEWVERYNPNENDFEKFQEQVYFKHEGEICPHFSWDGDTAVCAIHEKFWFKGTPCGSHGQIESDKSDLCRTGKYIRDKHINVREVFFQESKVKKLKDMEEVNKKDIGMMGLLVQEGITESEFKKLKEMEEVNKKDIGMMGLLVKEDNRI